MVRLTRRRALALTAATGATAAGTIGAVATSASADRTLLVADAADGDALLEIPVDDGEELTLSYTHSVEKTPVEDVYVVDGDVLRMDRMVFQSFGAGLPTDDIERTDEGYVRESDESTEELRVTPGSIAGHELVVGAERYDLVERSDGRTVTLSVTDRTLRDALETTVDHER
ncbi:DUF1850 domain-containing protein [Natronorubrum daqingense]|uniref:DUF1850 domain-containing protein n=1 Tax=Natronorubrum daqingense TaxID=588898 RepID=A0A1N7EQ17_9EURY|nr:DUF1850 domain-containing protein [Natronorubrum daqingense]SIR90203.1 hypothetical protein SAMN05421809_2777 [Natronorubrum daqingense]